MRTLFAAVFIAAVLVGALGVPEAHTGTTPAGFHESVVLSGLTNPTVVRFAPDGRVFIAEKSGLIKVFDGLTDTTPTVFADLRTNVYNFWDRGLLGLALAPNFPTNPYVYVLYTYDHVLGDASPPPKWGTPGAMSDPCPTPPGATSDGCVVSGRLSRLQANGNAMTGSEQVLIEDWCQQYPSHSVGAVEFGPDGALYASGGDGASFTFVDYGQDGNPLNPCGDPPAAVGGAQAPPSAEGGSLRSQDLRTSGDTVTLDGSIIRVDPATGAALSTNPLFAASDPNARRIIAHGLRNPFRFAFRPGTSELWIGDVGWNDWEEINRITNPTDSIVENFGWPCYEGNSRQSGFDAANLTICENLYSSPNAVAGPFFAFHHTSQVVPGETCPTGSSSVSGLSFEFGPVASTYPPAYQRALFFADYSRDCIWVMKKDANGVPAPGLIETFVADAANPVNLEFGPGGELFYVDFDGGTIRRIVATTGVDKAAGRPASASSSYGAEFEPGKAVDGSSATRWSSAFADSQWWQVDLGGPLSVDSVALNWETAYASRYQILTSLDGTSFSLAAEQTIAGPGWQMTSFTVRNARYVRVLGVTRATPYGISFWDAQVFGPADSGGGANQSPLAVIDRPPATTTWKVGDSISFSGHAVDPEQGNLPASALSWKLLLQHCPSTCHTHTIQTWSGVASGSFSAPDHEYPSYLELELTATDSSNATGTTTVRLDPVTVVATFGSTPSGLQLAVNGASSMTQFTRTLISGSSNSLSAITPQTLDGCDWAFGTWSDGGAQTHQIVASASATYTAAYVRLPCPPRSTSLPTISGVPAETNVLAAQPGSWVGTPPINFAFQWLRCDNGGKNCSAITGATASNYTLTASDVGRRMRVTVTATNSDGTASATSAATAIVKRSR